MLGGAQCYAATSARGKRRAIERRAWDDRSVGARKKKRSKRDDDPLAVYRRIRKPMPPPEKVIPDRRRELDEEGSRREMEDR
jgi:hypothetical protein